MSGLSERTAKITLPSPSTTHCLVSSKTPVLESLDLLRRRFAEAAKYVDPSRLAISPQCGFASTMGGNPVTEDDERAKLRLCVEAARALQS